MVHPVDPSEDRGCYSIIHQTSCPRTPQQNGVAERKNRHLMEVAQSIMFHMNVPKKFLGYVVVAGCYLINRTPTRVFHDISPLEVLTETKPSIDHLRVFGCVCYVLVPGENRNKLEAKSTKSMFIGYSITQKEYKCLVPETGKVLVFRDVKFLENTGYYTTKDWKILKNLPQSHSDRAEKLIRLFENLGISSSSVPPVPSTSLVPPPPPLSFEMTLFCRSSEAGTTSFPLSFSTVLPFLRVPMDGRGYVVRSDSMFSFFEKRVKKQIEEWFVRDFYYKKLK